MNLSTWRYSNQALNRWIEHDFFHFIRRNLPAKMRHLSEIIGGIFLIAVLMTTLMILPIPLRIAATILKKQTASPLIQLIAKITTVIYEASSLIPVVFGLVDLRWQKFQVEANQILKSGDVNQILPYLQKKGKYLASLDLSFPRFSPGLSDQDLQEIVKHCPNLRKINLNHSKVTDLGLSHLSTLHLLEHLEVESCSITDAGIQSLKTLSGNYSR